MEKNSLFKNLNIRISNEQYDKLLKIIAYDFPTISISGVIRLLINNYDIKKGVK